MSSFIIHVEDTVELPVVFSGWGLAAIETTVFRFGLIIFSKWLKEKKKKQKAKKYYTFEKKARELQRILVRLQSILEFSTGKGARDDGLRLWLVEVQDKAFDASPLVEGIILGLSQRKSDNKYKCATMTEDIENFSKELDSLLKEYDSLHMPERLTYTGSERMYQSFVVHTAESSSIMHESHIWGREQESEKLIRFINTSLLVQGEEQAKSSSSNHLHIIPIVGICGVGKTTLARIIYNHFSVSTTGFQIRIWISMHYAFDLRCTTKDIIEHATQTKLDDLGLDSLQDKLQKLLIGKQFLLVLDGASHENREDWQKLFAPLHGKMGTILVTTQSPTVSSIVREFGTSIHFPLFPLSEDDCYSLFCQEAFGKGNEPKTELLDVSRTIASKCHGLPMVANTFGNMLRLKEDEHEWNSISRTDLHRLPEYGNAIISAFRFSFSRFPPHVRKLFPYCAMFPRGYKFTRDYLIRLWMAEGLLNSRSSEERAMLYFQDMEKRQLFTRVDEGVSGTGFQEYQLIGLMYEMAQLLFYDEAFRVTVDKKTDLEGKDVSLVRQMSIVSDGVKLEDILRFQKLRTLIILTEAPTIEDIPSKFWKNMKLLTVLDLAGCSISIISDDIRDLKLLRYLNLSRNPIEKLPPAVADLSMLETLSITGCSDLESITSKIGNLTQLRYLDVDHNAKFGMPSGIGKLICLHELKRFVLGRKVSPNELENMAELRVLHVSGLETVKFVQDAKQARLGNKDKLRKLTLQWSGDCRNATIISPELQPHKNLKELVIKGIQCNDLMLWDWTSLSSLTHVQLHGCAYLDSVHHLGCLPLLKKMELVGNNRISELGPPFFWNYPERTRYPKLEEITLHGWTSLKKWMVVSSNHTFPALVTIVLSDCSAFSSFGAIIRIPSTLKHLHTRGSTRPVPRVDFEIQPLERKHLREALKYS